MTGSKSTSETHRRAALPTAAVRRVQIAGAAATLVVSLLLALGQGRDGGPFAATVFDLYQRLAPRVSEDRPVRIVAIDEASLAEFGSWPWPRHYLAILVEALVSRGAKAVGFDMVFPEPDRHGAARLQQIYGHLPEAITAPLAKLPEPDEHFAARLSWIPSVVGRIGLSGKDMGGHPAPDSLVLNADIQGSHEGVPHHPGVVANVDILDAVAAGHGLLNGAPDDDGVVRRVPLLGRVGTTLTPSFALELVRVAKEHDTIMRSDDRGRIHVGAHTIATDESAHLRLHASHPRAENYLSAGDVLAGRTPEDAVRDKIIIIAAASAGLTDIVATPVVGETFGADLHLQTIETILGGGELWRPNWAYTAEWAVLILFATLVIVAAPRTEIWKIGLFLLVCVAGAWLVGWYAFTIGRMLVDPVHSTVGLIVVAMASLGMLVVEAERRQKALAGELAATELKQARVTGELSAAREMQLGILPDAKRIPNLPPSIEVAALLEPAREIGGDLYDLFMLDDRRLFFMVGDVTGKGVPAALFMSISKVLTKSAITRIDNALEDAVRQANLEISRENPADLFVTILAGIIDCATGEAVLVNAGHDDPLRLQAAGGVEQMTCVGGPPLCVVNDYPYEMERFTVDPGDTVLIVTDGVTEARAPDGSLFGNDRLRTMLGESDADRGGAALLENIRDRVREFEDGQPATDDLTLMAIRYRPD